MKHLFDAVTDNGVFREGLANNLPRSGDQVKDQLINPGRFTQSIHQVNTPGKPRLSFAALDLRPDVTKFLYRPVRPEPAVSGGDFP